MLTVDITVVVTSREGEGERKTAKTIPRDENKKKDKERNGVVPPQCARDGRYSGEEQFTLNRKKKQSRLPHEHENTHPLTTRHNHAPTKPFEHPPTQSPCATVVQRHVQRQTDALVRARTLPGQAAIVAEISITLL